MSRFSNGVQRAVAILASGLVAHPANSKLQERLRTGCLSTADFYSQVLRITYRVIFLLIAEDRDCLHADATAEARSLYSRQYSMARLRSMTSQTGMGTSLWENLTEVFVALEVSGDKSLGLPALGGHLWSSEATRDILGTRQGRRLNLPSVQIQDADLLAAIRALAFRDGQDPVDFTHLNHEELGAAYEDLLELRLRIDQSNQLEPVALVTSRERKTSGSYYTPPALVHFLLESGLDPVIEEAAIGKSGLPAESAILAIRVCDPACGAGHILVAAARRLASRLAQIRSADDEPDSSVYRQALREVIRCCIYGVDLNPMAVELCKVALWIESLEPGQPLSFLDDHIKCGNALLGATPKLIEDGVPDDAFEPLGNRSASFLAFLRRRNRSERSERLAGQSLLPIRQADEKDDLQHVTATLSRESSKIEDDPIATVRNEAEKLELSIQRCYKDAQFVAHAWCAAFLWPKRDSLEGVLYGKNQWDAITDEVFSRIKERPSSVPAWIRREILEIAESHRFFHWHLEFPEVFANGRHEAAMSPQSPSHCDFLNPARTGFDVILGNPPFLNQLEAATATARDVDGIIRVRTQREVRGYTDLSAAFLVLATQLVADGGRVALVQPQSVLAVKDAAPVRSHILRHASLVSLWVSNERVFPGTSIYTCAPTLQVGGPRRTKLRRFAGVKFRELPALEVDTEVLMRQETWAHLSASASGIPEIHLPRERLVGDIAHATADFRDQYYGLEGFLVEDRDLSTEQRRDWEAFPPIVTTGLIDLATCKWGTASTRILKSKWNAPRVDRRRMEACGELGGWIAARLVPKVLVATQTRVIEALVDVSGALVPSIPIITLTPKDPSKLWLLAAAVCSPVCSAIALEQYAGAALCVDAIKLSAKQVLRLPLPTDVRQWEQAATFLELAAESESMSGRRAQLLHFGAASSDGYGLPSAKVDEIVRWWGGRLERAFKEVGADGQESCISWSRLRWSSR